MKIVPSSTVQKLKSWFIPLLVVLVAGRYLYEITGYLEFDTRSLIQETAEAMACLKSHVFAGCRGGGQFPLLQKLPAASLLLFGLKHGTVLRLLTLLNAFAFIGLMLWPCKVLRKLSNSAASIFLSVLLSGFVAWYGRSSFSEMLAAFFLLGTVILASERQLRPWPYFLFFLAAALTKETATPFVCILAALAFTVDRAESSSDRFRLSSYRRQIFITGAAAALAVMLHASFNYFRFRSLMNLAYMTPSSFVKEASDQFSFFLAIWFSPNGGLFIFWPSFAALFLFLASVTLWKNPREIKWWGWIGAALFLLTLGFSKWACPLGWRAWGSRLILPWIPAILFLLVRRTQPVLPRLLLPLMKTRWAFWSTATVLSIASYPQFYVLFSKTIFHRLFLTTSNPACVDLHPEQNMPLYYKCLNYTLWSERPAILYSFSPLNDPAATVFTLICIYLFIRALLKIRDEIISFLPLERM
jgi:hypothetical protein